MGCLIKSKQDYYNLAKQGLVGNSPKMWDSAVEFLKASKDSIVGIRAVQPGSKKFVPYASRHELVQMLRDFGLRKGEYFLTENVPGEEVRLTGELGWFAGQWNFFYSKMKTHMRRALAVDGHQAFGFEALMLIREHATATEWENLMDLFDYYSINGRYPVIELTFTTEAHGIHNQYLLIWEVRHY